MHNNTTTADFVLRIGLLTAPPYVYPCALHMESLLEVVQHSSTNNGCLYPGLVVETLAYILNIAKVPHTVVPLNGSAFVQLFKSIDNNDVDTVAMCATVELLSSLCHFRILAYTKERLQKYNMSQPVDYLWVRVVLGDARPSLFYAAAALIRVFNFSVWSAYALSLLASLIVRTLARRGKI